MARGRVVAVLTVVAGLVTVPIRPAAAVVPSGFSDDLVVAVSGPTALAFTPDRRMLVTTQGGTLRVVQNGAMAASPAVDLTSRICSQSERGVLGVAVDPAFATNRFVYLYYTHNLFGTCVNRVSRWVLNDANVASGEVVLIDRIHSPSGAHNGGDLQFGKDGYLYVSVGDGGCDYAAPSNCGGAANDAARDRHVLLGKILRITRDPGVLPPDNPFLGPGSGPCHVTGSTTAGDWCRETFAWGFRNPFRMAFDPNAAGVRLYVNDVGEGTWEEIDDVRAGADHGWNVREGHCARGSSTNCGPPPAGMSNPVFDYGRGDGCGSITGGAFVPAGVWPDAFDGKYLFSDFNCGRIFRLDPNGAGGFTRTDFATGLGSASAVHMAFGPWNGSQALYYTSYASGGQIRRIATTTVEVISGAAFFVDGSSARTMPAGSRVSVFANGAEPGVEYRLVSARADPSSRAACSIDAVPISPTVRYANANGFVGLTSGSVNRPPGDWQICFLAADRSTATGPARVSLT